MVEVLSALIILLTGQQTALTCGYPPPGEHWTVPGLEGYAAPAGVFQAHIWLERCDLAYKRVRLGLTALGHEILHVRYPGWTEEHVRSVDDWYGNVVVRRWMNRIENG